MIEGPGHFIAAGIRAEGQEGRGPWLGAGIRECRSCERPSLSLEDGECPGCRGDAEERDALVRQANTLAGARARVAQEKRGRLNFLKGWR